MKMSKNIHEFRFNLEREYKGWCEEEDICDCSWNMVSFLIEKDLLKMPEFKYEKSAKHTVKVNIKKYKESKTNCAK